ncbi:phytoene desaturase family protein [Peribacillus sp. SCS-37]|uniref:phytoene desaturase family protein n=1 Tax=Paraperibacillus esterisolvens TaxID=3115296 RepID=UPI003905B5C3
MPKSVCVIGAGIGGLTAGAVLAKQGYEVTVFEKAVTVGGSAGWYVRKGRRFPSGATVGFGLEAGGLLRRILDSLDISLPAKVLSHSMDVVLPGGSISIYQDPQLWEQELKRVFPGEAGVHNFWADLHQIGQDVHGVSLTGVSLPLRKLHDMGSLPSHALRHPASMLRLARYASWTVEDLMKKHSIEHIEMLRQFLDAQLIDAVQTNVKHAALLPSSLALTIYRQGSFAVEKGLGEISQVLADKIIEHSGHVLTASPLKSLEYDSCRKKWQAAGRKVSGEFDAVINNSGVSFGPGTSISEKSEIAWGAFRLDCILSGRVRETLEGINFPFAYQIMPEPALAQVSPGLHGPVYVTFHESSNAAGEAVEDEVMMTLSVHSEISVWEGLDKARYLERKSGLQEKLLSILDRVIPVSKHLISAEAGTPLTYENFIGKKGVGGFPMTVENAIFKPFSIRTSLPGFYIAGEQAFPGPGTLSAALSGYHAARAVMKD